MGNEAIDWSKVPPSPYTKVDGDEIKRYPGEVVAIHPNGEGIIRDENGEPVHAQLGSELHTWMEQNLPCTDYTYVEVPATQDKKAG